jgi:uncharacterized membrane protein
VGNEGFVQRYFLGPIRTGEGYNPVNTAVYAVGFVAFVGLIFEGLRRSRVPVARFALAFAPYILLTSLVRSLVDAGVYPRSVLTVTPGIYGVSLAVALGSIAAGLAAERLLGTPWDRASAALGSLLLLAHLPLVSAARPWHFAGILALAASSTALVWSLLALAGRSDLATREGLAVVAGQMLDASATFVGVTYAGFSEQHVLPNLLFGAAGTAGVFIPVKAALAVAVLHVARRDIEDSELARFVRLVAFVLGAGPGMRDALSVLMVG